MFLNGQKSKSKYFPQMSKLLKSQSVFSCLAFFYFGAGQSFIGFAQYFFVAKVLFSKLFIKILFFFVNSNVLRPGLKI